jgi:hypothetical protein
MVMDVRPNTINTIYKSVFQFQKTETWEVLPSKRIHNRSGLSGCDMAYLGELSFSLMKMVEKAIITYE